MFEQLEKGLGGSHAPAKEKLLWLVNNAGSLWWLPDREGDLISSYAFCLFEKNFFQHGVRQSQHRGIHVVLTSGNI